MRTLLYLIGMLLVVAALAYGAMLLGVPQIWVALGVLVLVGLIVAGAARSAGPPGADTTGTREVHHHHGSY